jgi:hypothetical protein
MSEQDTDVFIIDSNALITPYKFYYSFEIAPRFWDVIAKHIERKNIVILDKVFDEISAKDDPLGQWIKNIDGLEPISYKDSEIIDYTVITFETFNQGLNINQPSKVVKIPNVCQQFDVVCKDLYYMMHKLSIRL